MKEFKDLMEVADLLNSEKGCPWDLEQTFETLLPYVLEEAHEVLEAVDEGKDEDIIEELGDLFYTVVFYAKVAEREKRFTLKEILDTLRKKLVRRHPHVFGDAANDMETIKNNWEKIKKQEKSHRKNPLDGIPKTLPILTRGQKVIRSMKKYGVESSAAISKNRSEELAHQIFTLICEATIEEIDIESAVRKVISSMEKELRASQLDEKDDLLNG